LNSVTALVSTAASLVNTYAYDPWGQSIASTGTAYNPFQFTSVYLDSATTLYRMDQRFYQPAAGRFTQLDPKPCISNNRYVYTDGNPTNFIDPTGLNACAFVCSMFWVFVCTIGIPASGPAALGPALVCGLMAYWNCDAAADVCKGP
jgi:RHS repeat-associated protein